MEIRIEDLKSVTDKLISHLQELGVETVDISADYYWYIEEDEVYSPGRKPTQIHLGQLSDDWSELQRLLLGGRDPLAVDLVTLSTILRAIGENVLG